MIDLLDWIDVMVIDVRMPPTYSVEGLMLAAQLQQTRPELGVLVVTSELAPWHLGRLRRLRGGWGYLGKDQVADGQSCMTALEAVRRGHVVLDPSIVDGAGALDLSTRELSVRRTSP